MRPSPAPIAAALLVLGGMGAAAAVAEPAPVGTAQQTSPRVLPQRVHRRTSVRVAFTLAEAPGHHGVVATDYRVRVGRPPGSRPACASSAPAPVVTGERGELVRVALRRPVHGWCLGRYAVTIFEQRGPYCLPPAPGTPPAPCPLFASQDLDVGHVGFTVRRVPAP